MSLTSPPEDCQAWSQQIRQHLLCRGRIDGAALILSPAGVLAHAEGRLSASSQRPTAELCRMCLNLFRYNCSPAFDAKVLNARLTLGGYQYRPFEKSATVVHCAPLLDCGGGGGGGGVQVGSCCRCDLPPPAGGLIIIRVSAGVLLVTYPSHVLRQSAANDVHSFCDALP